MSDVSLNGYRLNLYTFVLRFRSPQELRMFWRQHFVIRLWAIEPAAHETAGPAPEVRDRTAGAVRWRCALEVRFCGCSTLDLSDQPKCHFHEALNIGASESPEHHRLPSIVDGCRPGPREAHHGGSGRSAQ